jgi:aspartate racemase
MVVWYHRRPPIRLHDDGRPREPREIDPELVEAARWLGKAVDFIGVTGFAGAPAVYVQPLQQRGIQCSTIDAQAQAPLDAAIHAVAEGREGADHVAAARTAVAALRSQATEAIILGCTEIPLLLGADKLDGDLINPAALLAEAAVRFAIEQPS